MPPARIPDLLAVPGAVGERYNVLAPCFGHAADGNLHVHILKKPEMPLDVWQAQERAMLTALYEIVVGLGGTITGEHGIGAKRAGYLPLAQSPELIALQRRIKAAFDPLGILNPGKSSRRCRDFRASPLTRTEPPHLLSGRLRRQLRAGPVEVHRLPGPVSAEESDLPLRCRRRS